MRRLSPAFAIIFVLTVPVAAHAQGRTYTRAFTCAALKAFVAQAGNAVLASSENAYETVHQDSGACPQDETGAPAYEPTSDVPACFAGWRCKQRNSDNNQK